MLLETCMKSSLIRSAGFSTLLSSTPLPHLSVNVIAAGYVAYLGVARVSYASVAHCYLICNTILLHIIKQQNHSLTHPIRGDAPHWAKD